MLEQLSSTITKLYSAAANPGLWSEALDSVEQITGSAGAVLNVIRKDDLGQSFILHGPRISNHYSEAEVDEYNRELLPHCPRVAAGIANPNLPLVCDYMILTENEMDQNIAYVWYKRHGLRYFIGAPIGETARHRLMWSLQRTPSQGHAQAEDLRLFEVLKPHVARALMLAEDLRTLCTFERFGSTVLDRLPQPMFALSAAGAVLFANRAGEALLRARDALSLVGGQLRTRVCADQHRFDQLICEASRVQLVASSGWMRVRRSKGAPAYSVFIAPLDCADEELSVTGAKVLVVIHDTTERRSVDAEMLTQLYGLSVAEARVASALSAGHSIESAAALLGIRQATARSELKSVFRKMGISRQQDLVRLLTSLSSVSASPV